MEGEFGFNFADTPNTTAFCLPKQGTEWSLANPESVRDWIIGHAAWLAEHHRDTADDFGRGIWVITKTYATGRATKILRMAGDDGSISGVRLHNGEISNANLNSAKQEGSFKVKASLRANRDPHGDKLVVFFQSLHFTVVEKLEQDT
jgi:hypothetical protein